ncbi:hypothetical protein LOK49_Contig11G00011 [Camellia lanceoleosa]|nr:hypothetical protein LOK49_Contig11G00011 [Camellia lanceoleosa]
MPMVPEEDYVARFSLGVVYYIPGDECSIELDDFPYAIISDKINGIDLTYTPTFFGIPGSYGDYIWISHIEIEEYFGYQIKGGEQFEDTTAPVDIMNTTALQLVIAEDVMVTAGDIIFIMFTVNITDMVAVVVVTMEDVTVMVGDIMVTVVAILAKGTIAMVDVEVTARDIIMMWSSLSMSVPLKL